MKTLVGESDRLGYLKRSLANAVRELRSAKHWDNEMENSGLIDESIEGIEYIIKMVVRDEHNSSNSNCTLMEVR